MHNIKKITRSEKKEYYTLSPSQKRLYLIQRFDPGSIAYNLAEKVPYGSADLERIEDTINTIVARHDILRTTFHAARDGAFQVVHPHARIKIGDFLNKDLNEEALFKVLVRPFDLEVYPLLRLTNIRNEKGEPAFLFVEFHHILFDATSVALFFRMFNDIYSGGNIPVPALQYHDYSEWFRRSRSPALIRRQTAFWKARFPGPAPVLELPEDFQRPPVRDSWGNSLEFALPADTTAALKSLAAGLETTLFTILLSVYKILLRKLSGQDDIVVGIPVSGRNRPELAGMLGMFVNSIPIRSTISGDLSFIDFLKRVKVHARECLDNQDIQFEEIVSSLALKREPSRSLLFDVLFDMINHRGPGAGSGDGIDPEAVVERPVTSQYDVVLKAIDMGPFLSLRLEYTVALFDKHTMLRVITFFRNILSAVLADVHVRIDDLEILGPAQKEMIINEFNDTRTDFPPHRTIHSVFAERALLMGALPAVCWDGNTMSYRELDERSNQLARYILKQGTAKGEIIGIMMPRCGELLVAIMGVLRVGCSYLPLDPGYPGARLRDMVKDSGLTLVLTVHSLADKYEQLGDTIRAIDMFSSQLALEDKTSPETDSSSSDLAYLIYTSGSTGKPKGVMIEHRNVLNLIGGITEKISCGQGDTILCLTTFSFDIFVVETIVPLLTGMKIILADAAAQKDPDALSRLIRDHGVGFLQMTPSHLRSLLKATTSGDPLKGVRVLIVGGEAFPSELLQELKACYDGKIYNMYAPTETTVYSTLKDLSDGNAINIGKPMANVFIRILDRNGKIQPVGVPGEICIGGEGVARGYWRNERLTDDKFTTDPFSGGRIYRTGDLGKWLPDGEVQYLGRTDSQLKIRGFRIEPGEIESWLSRHESISEVVVDARGEAGDKFLVAWFVSEGRPAAALLRNYLLSKLPDYMVPSLFFQMDRLPLTPSGKLDRNSLPDPCPLGSQEGLAPATNETEEKLIEIWAEILELEKGRIGIHSDFFDLGGHSLNIVKMNKVVNAKFGSKISAGNIFRLSNIRAIADHIQNHASLILLTLLISLNWLSVLGQGSASFIANGRKIDVGTFNEQVARLMRQAGVPGVSLAVISNNRIVFCKAYGYKKLSTREKLDGQTIFEACSLSKNFLAYAVYKLVDEGKLDLDKPLYQYLENKLLKHDPRYKLITARMVLSHSSGIENFRWLNDPDTLEIVSDPGEKFVYSGEGYDYLGEVVESILMKPYRQYISEMVLEPLHLKRTYLSYSHDGRFPVNYATGHDFFEGEVRKWKNDYTLAAAGIHVDARDYATLILSVFDGNHLSTDRIRDILRPAVRLDENNDRVYYGPGFEVMYGAHDTIISHGGSYNGFKNLMYYSTVHRCGLVILTNSDRGKALARKLCALSVRLDIDPYFELDDFEQYPNAAIELSDIYLKKGPEQLFIRLEELEKMDKRPLKTQVNDLNQLAGIFSDKDTAIARRLLTNIIKLYPGSPLAYFTLGEMEMSMNAFPQAYENLKIAKELRINDVGLAYDMRKCESELRKTGLVP